MPTYECPRGLTEPPTCTAPDQAGLLHFTVHGPEYDVNAGAWAECDERNCDCDLSDDEWAALEERAVRSYYEGPSEP
jgi:hypothetical protein